MSTMFLLSVSVLQPLSPERLAEHVTWIRIRDLCKKAVDMQLEAADTSVEYVLMYN